MTKKPDGVERRTIEAGFEVRDADGMSFTGYAAVFNSDSEWMGFTEQIAPGAFRSTLKSRNRVMLLANHNPEKPLASTRSGTLRLAEDDRGLRVEAKLPDTTAGRDMAYLVRESIVDSMSFGFTTVKDKWEGERRTVLEAKLHEVSIVTFPAYEATTAAVRSVDVLADATGEDAAALSDLLDAVASGTLNAEQKRLLLHVADKIGPADVVDAVAEAEPAVPLDVLKAQIDLLGKDI